MEDDDKELDFEQVNVAIAKRQIRTAAEMPVLSLSVVVYAIPQNSGMFLYETMMSFWIQAAHDHAEGHYDHSEAVALSHTASQWRSNVTSLAFFQHIDFFLPLLLKSITVRISIETKKYPLSTKATFDGDHELLFVRFVEMLAQGLIGEATTSKNSSQDRDLSLRRATVTSKTILDFLIGLLSVLQFKHMNELFAIYFKTLREAEKTDVLVIDTSCESHWAENMIYRIKCSRHLRMSASEALAVLPCFVAINAPLRFSSHSPSQRTENSNWLNQDAPISQPSKSGNRPDIESLPRSGWLSDLVLNETLTVCVSSCESLVEEAIAQIELSRGEMPLTSSLRKRQGTALKSEDLLVFQSIAIHAISIVYELIIRRHALDRRFQSDSAPTRIAALFAKPILDHSVVSSRWLSKLEANHKIRSIWLLCFIYVLQEAPESLIYDYVRECCTTKASHCFLLIAA